MHQVKFLKLGVTASVLGFCALESASVAAQDVIAVAHGIDMWDGQWHLDITGYGWVPWMYSTVQLPAIAGGGKPTIETQPSQYLKYVEGGVMLQGTIRKGDWNLWTDLFYVNLKASTSVTRELGLPGGDATLPVILSIEGGMRMAIWTLAPSYTVVHNDIGSLDVLAGLRYSSTRVSLSYEFTAPPTPLMRGGGFWPTADSTDAIVGIKGALHVSSDGKWFMPYEADVGTGNKNWQYNAFFGAGYHFRWGDVTLAVRNLTYNRTGNVTIEKMRMTGPLLGATFRW